MESYLTLKKRKIGSIKNKKIEYLEDIGTFDTEWTNVIWEEDGKKHGVGLLYVWQCCLFGDCYYGRTIEEFTSFLRNVTAMYGLNTRKRLVLYVHNLSADFQFMRGWMNFDEVAAMSKRGVLSCRWGGIEFRCSYKLSNMSLKKFLEDMHVEHQKKPDYDYAGIRTPDTELDEKEMEYAENDVLGLYEAVKARMAQEDDDVVSIPRTATGYVRRHMRDACFADKRYKLQYRDQKLTAEQYELCRKAFRGGNTHANRAYTGKTLRNIRSYDKTSDYPSACVYEEYPMGAFYATGDIDGSIAAGYAVLMDVEFLDLETKDPIPYLSLSKCSTDKNLLDLSPEMHKQALVIDNGRILRAKGWTRTALTEVDYKIVKTHYRFKEMRCIKAYKAIKRKLPLPIRKTISEFFEGKTALKGVKGQEYFYMKSKNMLNSTYGMMVMALIRPGYEIEDMEWKEVIPEDKQESLNEYYKKRTSFLHYQWGVWVTAYARKYLQELIDICGDKIVYCDTDSAKFIDDVVIKGEVEKINARIKTAAEEAEVPCIIKDQVLGAWDDEGEYDLFKTYGAKKYCDVLKGEFEFTVSGLGKAALGELRSMDDFTLGRTYVNSGRTISEYDDNEDIHYVEVNGKKYPIRANMCIIDTTYTLGVSDDYFNLIDELQRNYVRKNIKGKKIIQMKSSIGFDPD